MVNAATNTQLEFCSECGDFTPALNDITGWCESCSAPYLKRTRTQVEAFLLTHADHIEHYLLQGKTLNQAIDALRLEIASFRTCACCGGFIRRAGPTAVFCRQHERCRSVSRRYVYLYQRKGLSKPEALAEVLSTINGSE